MTQGIARAHLRRARYVGEDYFRDAESSVELGAEFLVTYLPRDENYMRYLRSFAREVTPSFT